MSSATLNSTWRLRDADPASVERLVRARSLPEPLARILVARGHVDPERVQAHLDASLHALHDPARLDGVALGAARIARAVRERELILVHGDYDVDGVTGTALLMRLFQLIGARAEWFIPHRFKHGYSFGPHSVEEALAR